jgi:hypothetical protein
MKVFCPECIEPMEKIKIKVGETVNIRNYNCKECGTNIRIED